MTDSQSTVLEAVSVGSKVCDLPGMTVHQGVIDNDVAVSVITLQDAADPLHESAFQRIVRHGAASGLIVERADHKTIVASPSASGTVEHLPTLGWRLPRRLDVFRQIAQLVQNFHDEGNVAGPLDPRYIMLDDALHPFILGPRVVPESGLYAAPETTEKARVDVLSDVFSLGRLLHFVIAQHDPEAEYADPLRLDNLMTFPAGLSRIVRKATRKNATDRYSTPAQMLEELGRYGRYEEVGIAHPDVEEQNFAGLSQRPTAIPMAVVHSHSPPKKEELNPAAVLENLEPFKLRHRTRMLLMLGGVISLIGAFVFNYFAGYSLLVRGLMSLCAGLIGFAIFAPGIDKEQTLRTTFALFFACAIFTSPISQKLAQAAEMSGLFSNDIETRAKSFENLKEKGKTEYSNLDLSGADLHGQIFLFTKIENISLEGADLTDTKFINPMFIQTRFARAKLQGAFFYVQSSEGMIGLSKAFCDEKTQLPPEWSCVDDHPEEGSFAPKKAAAQVNDKSKKKQRKKKVDGRRIKPQGSSPAGTPPG